MNPLKTLRVALLSLLIATPALVTAVSAASPVWAQDAGAEDPAQSRATAFRAVTGPEAEQVPGGTLMVAAYAVIFLFLLIYVVRLGKLQAGLARDVTRLETSLASLEAGDSGGSKPRRSGSSSKPEAKAKAETEAESESESDSGSDSEGKGKGKGEED